MATPNAPIQAKPRGTHSALARSVGIVDPVDGDAAKIGNVSSDAQAAPVFDESQMFKLVRLMGPEWVGKNLRKFAIDVEGRLAALDAATPSDLAGIAHGIIMMAAQCGFTELHDVSEIVQREARRGFGLDRITEMRAAGERALPIMRSYAPRP